MVEERARIARELHDVIAHNVSMMVVQAGAERRVLDDEQASTREVLETIEQIGRGALTEMRRLVGMLRGDAADSLAPQPGLDDVPTLVDADSRGRPAGRAPRRGRAPRAAGRHRAVGLPDRPGGADQRAQARRRRHAEVHVRYGADSLELEIVDDGTGAAHARPAAATASSACASASRSTADASTPAGERGGFAVHVLLPVR